MKIKETAKTLLTNENLQPPRVIKSSIRGNRKKADLPLPSYLEESGH